MNENITTKRILTFSEVQAIKAGENHEEIVDLGVFAPKILTQHANKDMQQYTGGRIFVRQSVAEKLAKLSENLAKELTLKVVFGYRHPELQNRYFQTERAKTLQAHPDLSDDEIDAIVHNFIAVPSVAGHPTGGAVDITLQKNSKALDMGSKISDFSIPEIIPTFSEHASSQQLTNRKLLHDLMLSVGFAPFYGEWWHFSYGDREWAAFYSQPSSLYSPIHIK